MADVAVTLRIMPQGVETNLEQLKQALKELAEGFSVHVHKIEEKPIAFGLEALEVVLLVDESKGDTEELEKEITNLANVSSVDVIDVRRAVG